MSTTVTSWLQVLLLPQQSVAAHVRLMSCGHVPGFVTVLRIVMVTLVPQQASAAVGGSKPQGVPHSTVLLVAQVITGGVVSTTRTSCVQVMRLSQQSLASQMREIDCKHVVDTLVIVATGVIVTFVPQHIS